MKKGLLVALTVTSLLFAGYSIAAGKASKQPTARVSIKKNNNSKGSSSK